MNMYSNIKSKTVMTLTGLIMASSLYAQSPLTHTKSHNSKSSYTLYFKNNKSLVKTTLDTIGVASDGDYFRVCRTGSFIETTSYNKDSISVKRAEELGLLTFKKSPKVEKNKTVSSQKNYSFEKNVPVQKDFTLEDSLSSAKNVVNANKDYSLHLSDVPAISLLSKGVFSLGLNTTSYIDDLGDKRRSANFTIGYDLPLVSSSTSAIKAYVGIQTNAPCVLTLSSSPYELSSTEIIDQTTFQTKNDTYTSTSLEEVSKTSVDLGLNVYKKISSSLLYIGGGLGVGEVKRSGTNKSYLRNNIISSSGTELFLGQYQLDDESFTKKPSIDVTSYFANAGMMFSSNWGLGMYVSFTDKKVNQVGAQLSFSF